MTSKHGVIQAKKRKKAPKMTGHRGRAWDQCTVHLKDGTNCTGYFDSTWGKRFYFKSEGDWYSAPPQYRI
jgi:hypothetical protein